MCIENERIHDEFYFKEWNKKNMFINQCSNSDKIESILKVSTSQQSTIANQAFYPLYLDWSTLWQNLEKIRYIREFVTSKFVITIKFCKDMLNILLGTQKNFAISEISLYPYSYWTSFTL